MVVTNFNFFSSVIPFKANSILIIDAYAKLILPFSCESLEMVRRWYAEIFDLTCLVAESLQVFFLIVSVARSF
jgi:hypothetical protein